MMTPEAYVHAPARVSIAERLVPSLGFAVAALSGAIGGLMLLRFLSIMRESETAGHASFFGGMAELEFVVGGVLVVAAVLGAIGVIVSIVRMFTTNKTSSPTGILLLMVGLLSLVPPFAMHYLLHLMKEVVLSPDRSVGISSIADTINAVVYFAIGMAALIVIVLLAFSLVPFSSKLGRKVSPVICLVLVEALVIFLAGIHFWGARESLVERDKDRVEEYSQPTESELVESEPPLPNSARDILDDLNSSTNSNSNTRTISGGVLNGKATSLPKPPYPPAAKAVRASGSVSVHVTVDEKGDVISANAVSGHPLLRAAATQAARQAKFPPTKLSGKPVRVTGVITYNFDGN